jgi:hypothetical protein
MTISGIELMQKIQKHQFKSAHWAAAQHAVLAARPEFQNPKSASSMYKVCTGAHLIKYVL